MNEDMIFCEEFYQKLNKILKREQILIEEPLSRHTTFKIGGPAKFLLLPHTVSQIIDSIHLCKENKLPFYIMGNGSNLLVSDEGYDGVIIKLGEDFSQITIKNQGEKYTVTAQAGVLLSTLSKVIGRNSLTGFEFAEGIPGTLGGAITMNAGAYDGEIKHSIVSATVLDMDGNILTLDKEQLKLDYRKSAVQDNHYIVLDGSFEFVQGEEEAIFHRMNELKERRRDKQPLEYPSAGSTFKRPEGEFAGRLIMDSGLRGYSVGKAMVSEKHCGFVINTGGATAAEVYTLIHSIIAIVQEKYGVVLEPEVKILGKIETT